MNLLDLLILLPIAYFAYRGFVNGFIREVFVIIGLIVAVYVTFEFMRPISGFIAPYVENRDRATIITGITLFVVIVATVQLAAIALEKFFEMARIGILNKLAGFIFGGLKSAILISAILLLLAGIDIPSEDARTNSVSYPYVIYVAPATYDVVAKLFPGTEDFIETIERSIQENNTLRNLPIFEKLDT